MCTISAKTAAERVLDLHCCIFDNLNVYKAVKTVKAMQLL